MNFNIIFLPVIYSQNVYIFYAAHLHPLPFMLLSQEEKKEISMLTLHIQEIAT